MCTRRSWKNGGDWVEPYAPERLSKGNGRLNSEFQVHGLSDDVKLFVTNERWAEKTRWLAL